MAQAKEEKKEEKNEVTIRVFSGSQKPIYCRVLRRLLVFRRFKDLGIFYILRSSVWCNLED